MQAGDSCGTLSCSHTTSESSTSPVSSRSSLASSTYAAAESSASPCSCRGGEIPHLKAQIDENESAVDEILSVAHQSIGFWSRLKSCQACLHGRLEELLAIYDKVVGVLQAIAGLVQASGPASNEPLEDPADLGSSCLEAAALRYQPLASPATTASASVPVRTAVPPMFLGELKLDHEQSLALLRTVCYDTLEQLASILYEVRQIKTVLDSRLDSLISDLLYRVLNIMEPMVEFTEKKRKVNVKTYFGPRLIAPRRAGLQAARMASSSMDNSFVPSVDISPFLYDPKSASVSQIVETVRHACVKTGFFQITGHGLSDEVQKGLFQASQKLFALSMKDKLRLDARTQIGRRGYDVLASQNYHADVLPDLKEGFYVGHDLSPEDPAVRARRFFMGPNVWPDEALLAPKDFREPVERYFAAVNSLALKVLDLVACTLPYGPDVFSNFSTGYVVAPLRLLHYPPAKPVAENDIQHGAGAHTDFGAITLLFQDDNPGLEVLDTQNNVFVPIEPTPGAIVVNVGDMLSAWTGGKYKSSVHRVINKRPTDRYSVAFFFDGNLDCPLDPLDGSGPGKGKWTVEKHMIKRIAESYGKKD